MRVVCRKRQRTPACSLAEHVHSHAPRSTARTRHKFIFSSFPRFSLRETTSFPLIYSTLFFRGHSPMPPIGARYTHHGTHDTFPAPLPTPSCGRHHTHLPMARLPPRHDDGAPPFVRARKARREARSRLQTANHPTRHPRRSKGGRKRAARSRAAPIPRP